MPSPVILLSANALAHASVFLLRQCPRFHGVAKNALIALHGKLNKIAHAIAWFLLLWRYQNTAAVYLGLPSSLGASRLLPLQ